VSKTAAVAKPLAQVDPGAERKRKRSSTLKRMPAKAAVGIKRSRSIKRKRLPSGEIIQEATPVPEDTIEDLADAFHIEQRFTKGDDERYFVWTKPHPNTYECRWSVGNDYLLKIWKGQKLPCSKSREGGGKLQVVMHNPHPLLPPRSF